MQVVDFWFEQGEEPEKRVGRVRTNMVPALGDSIYIEDAWYQVGGVDRIYVTTAGTESEYGNQIVSLNEEKVDVHLIPMEEE